MVTSPFIPFCHGMHAVCQWHFHGATMNSAPLNLDRTTLDYTKSGLEETQELRRMGLEIDANGHGTVKKAELLSMTLV